MSYFSVLGVLSNVQIWFHTKLHGTPIGQDDFGNKYYTQKARKGQKRERRWVIYAQKTEASLVPALWHGWLHHQTSIHPNLSIGRFNERSH